MNILFTCGGTAGHVNPAIALARIFQQEHPDVEAWTDISDLVKGRIRFVPGSKTGIRLNLRPEEDMLGIIHKIFEKYLALTHK